MFREVYKRSAISQIFSDDVLISFVAVGLGQKIRNHLPRLVAQRGDHSYCEVSAMFSLFVNAR